MAKGQIPPRQSWNVFNPLSPPSPSLPPQTQAHHTHKPHTPTHPWCCRAKHRAQRMLAAGLSSSWSPYCRMSSAGRFLGCRASARRGCEAQQGPSSELPREGGRCADPSVLEPVVPRSTCWQARAPGYTGLDREQVQHHSPAIHRQARSKSPWWRRSCPRQWANPLRTLRRAPPTPLCPRRAPPLQRPPTAS